MAAGWTAKFAANFAAFAVSTTGTVSGRGLASLQLWVLGLWAFAAMHPSLGRRFEVVLRLYEAHGARGNARVRLGVPFGSAVRTNALEDESGKAFAHFGDTIEIPYRPHELITLKVT